MKCIYPNWPAPRNIRALTTTRLHGVSEVPYKSMNLANHVGDDEAAVMANRQLICQREALPQMPVWLNQIHSTDVVDISNVRTSRQPFNADASYTNTMKTVCAVLTADCLPVLFCSLSGDEVAASHAGWRGLCGGILENTIKHFHCDPSQIMAWLGPAIGVQVFEVGIEVKQQFELYDPDASSAFQLINPHEKKYLADLYLLAKQRLNRLGISQIYGGEYCTYQHNDLFFSYRREKQTGRMASMIWIE